MPEVLTNREAWDLIGLKDGDEVVGVVPATADDDELVFVTSDAQLLHFPASAVRPQGRSAGGMAGAGGGGSLSADVGAKARIGFDD